MFTTSFSTIIHYPGRINLYIVMQMFKGAMVMLTAAVVAFLALINHV